ncbi:MAG: hypothetical protein H6827_09660 [Planctomycetes bacterium]|nr:hypothetical protein [Planctomycetota bacterium]
MRTLLRGPSFLNERGKAGYRLWVTTWVLPFLGAQDRRVAEILSNHGILNTTSQDQGSKIPGEGTAFRELLEAAEAAHFWLEEEKASPGETEPNEILRVLQKAIVKGREELALPLKGGRT